MTIVDDVVLDRKGSHARAELRTCAAHPRLFGQQIKSVDDVVNHCRQYLGDFEVPKDVVFVDQLPHTATGKVLKNVLRSNYESHFAG